LAIEPIGVDAPAPAAAQDWVFCEQTRALPIEDVLRAGERAPSTLDRYAGDFTFLHLPADGSIILVRSCAGRVPLYHATQGERILVGSRLDYLVAFNPAAIRLDGLGTALALSGYATFPEGRSPIAGVSCLPPAHRLQLGGPKSTAPQRYWTPRRELQRPTAARKDEHANQLRSLLCDTLRRELDPCSGNLLWCSGGVDSSALAALIAGELQLPLWTQSFTAPDEASARRDDSYLLALQERYRFARTWRATNTPEHCLQLARHSPKVSYPVSYFLLGGLSEVVREAPIKVVLGGEFADEGTGSPRNIGDWLDHAEARDLLNPAKLPNGGHTLRQWVSWRAKRRFGAQWQRLPEELGAMFQPAIREEYAAWAHLQRLRFAADHEPLRTQWFRCSQDAWRAEWWEAATSLGVRPLAPFYTRELLELYFECHPLEWFDGQRPKAVLRRAMRGKMPDWHRERPDKGNWPGFLENAQLPAALPSRELSCDVLDDAWLNATFTAGNAVARISARGALQLTWLANMLCAIDRLTASSPFCSQPATFQRSESHDVRSNLEAPRSVASG
jgi:asparagine synthetase B (glutamine-hydrolysing)